MLVTCVASPISATPVIRPKPAVTSGIPAATSEPKVNSRMISAAITPTAVAGPTLKPSALLDDLTARGDLQPRHVHAVDLVEHRLAGVVREQVGGLVVVDRRERGLAGPSRPGQRPPAPYGLTHLDDMRIAGHLGRAASSSRP